MENQQKENKMKICSNSKCITHYEKYLKLSFTKMTDKKDMYLCDYCERENKF